MLGTIVVKQVVQGVLRLVQVVKYSNGKTVRRLLDSNGIPTEILEDNGSNN